MAKGWLKFIPDPPKPTEVVMDPPQCVSCHHGHLVERAGPYGRFFGCSNFPTCRATYSHYDANMMYDCQDPWETFGDQPF